MATVTKSSPGTRAEQGRGKGVKRGSRGLRNDNPLNIRHGKSPAEAYEKNIGTYGRFADAPKYIDPREE